MAREDDVAQPAWLTQPAHILGMWQRADHVDGALNIDEVCAQFTIHAGYVWLTCLAISGAGSESLRMRRFMAVLTDALRRNGADQICIAASHGGWFASHAQACGFAQRERLFVMSHEEARVLQTRADAAPEIANMERADCALLQQIDAECFEPIFQAGATTLHRLVDDGFVIAARQPDGQYAGYAAGTPFGATVHLERLAVRPRARGQGWGKALVRALVTRSQCSRAVLNSAETQRAAHTLYRKLGFVTAHGNWVVWQSAVA